MPDPTVSGDQVQIRDRKTNPFRLGIVNQPDHRRRPASGKLRRRAYRADTAAGLRPRKLKLH